MPQKTPITLKREIAALLASGNVGNRALILDDKDFVLLLRAAIEQEGSISVFARRNGGRSYLSTVLSGKRPISSSLVEALGLRKVYTPRQNSG